MVIGTMLENLVEIFVNKFPSILAAAVVMFLGWFVGRMTYEILLKIFNKINFDKYFKKNQFHFSFRNYRNFNQMDYLFDFHLSLNRNIGDQHLEFVL